MTYTLSIPIDAPNLTAACNKAWEIVGKQCGLPFTVKASAPPECARTPAPTPAQIDAAETALDILLDEATSARKTRGFTQAELEDIRAGIVSAGRRNDPEYLAVVKAKAEGKAR